MKLTIEKVDARPINDGQYTDVKVTLHRSLTELKKIIDQSSDSSKKNYLGDAVEEIWEALNIIDSMADVEEDCSDEQEFETHKAA